MCRRWRSCPPYRRYLYYALEFAAGIAALLLLSTALMLPRRAALLG